MACSTRITIVRSTRFSAFSSFCVFSFECSTACFPDVVWLLRLSFFCFKIEIWKSNYILQNVSQKYVPKICCLINFWWTLHSSIYIEHISPSNLKVKFPRSILDSWIINRLQFRISEQYDILPQRQTKSDAIPIDICHFQSLVPRQTCSQNSVLGDKFCNLTWFIWLD